MDKIDKNKARVELVEAIGKLFEKGELSDRTTYVGDETRDLMAEAALSVLLAVEDVQICLQKEGMLEWME